MIESSYMGVSLRDAIQDRDNGLDFLRLVAASFVIISHSFALVGLSEPAIGSIKLGVLGVFIFFAMSGYLVAQSLDRSGSLPEFFTKRFQRIMPALIFLAVFTFLIIGPIFSDLSVRHYFANPTSWQYLNITSVFFGPATLPGVFTTNIFPVTMNGSLWTLGYEVAAYVLLAVFGIRLLKKGNRWLLASFGVAVAAYLIQLGWKYEDIKVYGLQLDWLVRLGAPFFVGALMAAHDEKIILRLDVFLVALIVMLSSMFTPFAYLFIALCMPYVVLYLGLITFKRVNLAKLGDFSYGMYIFAWPVQQSIVAISRNTISWWGLALSSWFITLIFAAFSWYWIEKPFLRRSVKSNQAKDR